MSTVMASDLASPVPGLDIDANGEPKLSKSYELRFVADWGGANFHRICAFLTQEFCDRAGPASRTCIWSLRDGGMDGLKQIEAGSADLAIATPAGFLGSIVGGTDKFAAMPHLRAIGTLPQNDRMVLALSPNYNISSFAQLKQQKPPLRLVTSTNDGSNLIGYVAERYLDAHGISKAIIESWGGVVLTHHRPEQCVELIHTGEADALLQEAIMTPWWRDLIDANKLVPLPAEEDALADLQQTLNLGTNYLPRGWWDNLDQELPALDFSDFVICVRDDMPDEVAYMLTWCLVQRRHLLEGQYKHLPPEKSALTYPLNPVQMGRTPIPLHPGAEVFYSKFDSKVELRYGVRSPF